jgi:hypothetical protein
MGILTVLPQPWWQKRLDGSLRPVMRFVAGPNAWLEEPQQTHYWNNLKFSVVPPEIRRDAIQVAGDPTASSRWKWGFVPLFHLPIIGGWRNYVVLDPVSQYRYGWHPGWITGDACGCSRVLIDGPVRLLRGPEDATFFGVTAQHGEPLSLRIIGYGRIGDGGPYCQMPLL